MKHLQVRPRYGQVRLNITLVIGLAIALFGVIKYFTTSQVNPVTGVSQRVALSPTQEVQLGLQSAPHMAAEMGGLVDRSDPRAQLVVAVGQKLVAQIGHDNPWKFQFHLLKDPQTINAFALPGGQVFITLGLMQKLQNEAQLAGVLGHETGHVIERHSAQQMAAQNLGQSLVGAIAVGASQQDNGQLAAYAASYANQFAQLHYSREDELQADGYGVNYMSKAGFDPREMIGVMEILKQASAGAHGPEFMQTHPDPGNRAEKIEAQIKKIYPQGIPDGMAKGILLKNAYPAGTDGSKHW